MHLAQYVNSIQKEVASGGDKLLQRCKDLHLVDLLVEKVDALRLHPKLDRSEGHMHWMKVQDNSKWCCPRRDKTENQGIYKGRKPIIDPIYRPENDIQQDNCRELHTELSYLSLLPAVKLV